MIILGIDPGTRHTGYGVVEIVGQCEAALDYGVVDMSRQMDHTLRLERIYATVLGVIDQFHPDVCAVEMPVYGNNAQSMLKLGRAQAAVMLAATHRQIPVTEYTPKEVKKSVVGNGNAAKEQVWFMIKTILNLADDERIRSGLDASDALGVALCHAHRVSSEFAGRDARGSRKSWESFVEANPGRIK